MEEIKEKGDQGLPVRMDEYDPSDPEEELAYEQKVIAAYEQKPENYEEILKVQLHDGTFNRKRLKVKRRRTNVAGQFQKFSINLGNTYTDETKPIMFFTWPFIYFYKDNLGQIKRMSAIPKIMPAKIHCDIPIGSIKCSTNVPVLK